MLAKMNSARILLILVVVGMLTGCTAGPRPVFRDPVASLSDEGKGGMKNSRRKTILFTVNRGVEPRQMKRFVSYLNCRVVRVVPPKKGRLYIIEVPAHLDAKGILADIEGHPWVERAKIRGERRLDIPKSGGIVAAHHDE